MTPPPRYPRDMIGYGPRAPQVQWPGGARVAISLVLNYEEGGENNILHGDAASEAFLSEIVGAAASDVASIRRKARKAAAKLTCVGDYDALTADERIRHNATVSLFGAIHSMTKRPQVKKLEAAVQTTGRTLPLARTLEAFTR